MSNFNPELSAEIMALFAYFSQVGVTVLIASYDTSLINKMQYHSFKIKSWSIAVILSE